MPTEIERVCLERGYRFSEVLTWGMAAERPSAHCRHLCSNCGLLPRHLLVLPYIDGVALKHI